MCGRCPPCLRTTPTGVVLSAFSMPLDRPVRPNFPEPGHAKTSPTPHNPCAVSQTNFHNKLADLQLRDNPRPKELFLGCCATQSPSCTRTTLNHASPTPTAPVRLSKNSQKNWLTSSSVKISDLRSVSFHFPLVSTSHTENLVRGIIETR